uniref:C-type lectin domain-containing protein n=1 Tax=Stegastes partitus TaxID=144197 RepID=A0A3B4Z9A6_9TELE
MKPVVMVKSKSKRRAHRQGRDPSRLKQMHLNCCFVRVTSPEFSKPYFNLTLLSLQCVSLYWDPHPPSTSSRISTTKASNISSSGHNSEVWIGLYTEIDWRWSDGFTGSGAEYRSWKSGKPNFYSAREFCVSTTLAGHWYDAPCLEQFSAVCYKAWGLYFQYNSEIILSKS